MAVALRLVEAPQFVDHVEYRSESASRGMHSLQRAFAASSPWNPTVLRHVIDRFSSRGDIVTDPWAITGHSGFEAALLGRHFVGSSPDTGDVHCARARLHPADIAEVALRLQLVNLKRPVDVRGFASPMNLFFDVDTFCELVNLRTALRSREDRVDRFVQFVVATILHGHTVAHLSAYTSPTVALSPEAQAQLNRKRNEVPSYRAVAPRILKRAAHLLQEGIPSALQNGNGIHSVVQADVRNLNHLHTNSTTLALLAPEQPGFLDHAPTSWLRSWWLGIEGRNGSGQQFSSLESWQEYASEVLVESARVVKRGGRAVVRVGSGRLGNTPVRYRTQLECVLNQGLQSFWSIEGTVIERLAGQAVGDEGAKPQRVSAPGELVVLRRR
jgi:hypothetical protein